MIEVNTDSITIRNIDFTSTEYKKFEKEFSFYNSVTFKYNHKYDIILLLQLVTMCDVLQQ